MKNFLIFTALGLVFVTILVSNSLKSDNQEIKGYRQIKSFPSADKLKIYALYEDGECRGFGDLGWMVFEFEYDASEDEQFIACETNTTSINDRSDNLKLVLTNYAEGGNDTLGANIEIRSDRFLVMTRGGKNYGLFDTLTGETLMNIWSPWNEHHYSGSTLSYDEWVHKNLHLEIERIISEKLQES